MQKFAFHLQRREQARRRNLHVCHVAVSAVFFVILEGRRCGERSHGLQVMRALKGHARFGDGVLGGMGTK